ncbi:MAG: cyclic nucleotide-binding domain-containing protein [Spirochaetes bacterium]|nr:cyclic nucleotide-binding domain-containing protein [Spirochaetota bacterium]MBN2769989.1 cyclic nucleotide-binding domain-containing protein [Spirochaetota bacterium]
MSDVISGGGIRTRTYKSQAIVYFEGDKSESIYILKKGKVLLTYLRPETGEEIKEEVRPGEFFGVKSALGKYPREENAQTIGETVILILSPVDFERIVLSNIQVVKKMLRVFSNQLRRIGRAVREVMGETNSVDPANELYKIADHYSGSGRPQQALYAYKKYMEYYPDGKYASNAMRMIRNIESGNYQAPVVAVADEPVMSRPSVSESDDDFFASEPSAGAGSSFDDENVNSEFSDFDDYDDSGGLSDFGTEMDSFVSNSPDDGMMDDFGLGEPLSSSPEDKYNEAVAFRNNGDCTHAIKLLDEIKADNSVSDPDLLHKVFIETGRCKLEQGKLQEALSELSLFLKNYPRSPFVKEALLEAGNVYLKAGSKDKAMAYLKKVAAMPPRDELNQQALALLKQYKF